MRRANISRYHLRFLSENLSQNLLHPLTGMKRDLLRTVCFPYIYMHNIMTASDIRFQSYLPSSSHGIFSQPAKYPLWRVRIMYSSLSLPFSYYQSGSFTTLFLIIYQTVIFCQAVLLFCLIFLFARHFQRMFFDTGSEFRVSESIDHCFQPDPFFADRAVTFAKCLVARHIVGCKH